MTARYSTKHLTVFIVAASVIVLLAVSRVCAAASGDRRDYTTIHNFNVEIDGVIVGGFKEVDGLESKTEVIEYQGGNERTMHKRPGKTNYSNIILRYGLLENQMLLEWRKRIENSPTDKDSDPVERRNGSIVLYKGATEVERYNFFEAWPCRWKGPKIDSKADTQLVEEIELCVEKIERVP